MYKVKCCTCKEDFEQEDLVYAPKTKKYYYFCDDCYNARKDYKEDKYLEYKEQTAEMFKEKEIIHKINEFFRKYGFLDGRFFANIKKIRIGEFTTKQYKKEFSITYPEMLEILEMLKPNLDKIYNELKDKTGAIHYLLAVVYNKYPKYKIWKKEQIEKMKVNKIEVVTSVAHLVKKENSSSKEKDVDLNDFLL